MKKITMVMMALLLASGSAWATDNIAVFGSYWNTKDLDWGGGGDVGNLSNELLWAHWFGSGACEEHELLRGGDVPQDQRNCRGCPQRF